MKGIVRLDKVKSCYAGHVYSVQANEELQNGFIGHLGDLMDGEREVHSLVKPTTESIKKDTVVLIANPEISYEGRIMSDYALENYSIPANEASKAYELNRTDIFSVSDVIVDVIDKANGAKKGNYVVAQNGSFKLKEVETLDGTEVFVAKILPLETMGTTTVVGMPGHTGRLTKFIPVQVVKA
ncbi:hypothetical protein [Clostridium botulinum]